MTPCVVPLLHHANLQSALGTCSLARTLCFTICRARICFLDGKDTRVNLTHTHTTPGSLDKRPLVQSVVKYTQNNLLDSMHA